MSKRLRKGNLSIIEFQKDYDTEDKCREYFLKLRFPNGFVCPHCGGTSLGHVRTRNLLRCKSCRKQISVTSGTVFHHTKISLVQIIWAMFLFANDKRGCSAIQIMKALKVNYDTALYLLQRLRKAMRRREERYILKGMVELDDTYVGTSTHGKKRGRGTDKSSIIVAVAKDTRKATFAKIKVADDLKSDTFKEFASNSIENGSYIESDDCKALVKGLSDNYSVSHQVFSPEKDMLVHLHRIISNLKAFINGIYHGVTKEHLQEYLDEFCFRFNRRFFAEHLFERLALATFTA